jgi:hypothetical protein
MIFKNKLFLNKFVIFIICVGGGCLINVTPSPKHRCYDIKKGLKIFSPYVFLVLGQS